MLKDSNNQGGAGDRVPASRRDLLEQTKLSRLPSLPKRKPLFSKNPPTENRPETFTSTECAGCKAQLDSTDPINQRFCACRKCAGVYSRMILAMERKNEKQQKFILSKMIGGQI